MDTATAAQSPGEIPGWSLGDRIAKARRFARLEQADLAQALDISQALVSKWERDLRDPRVQLLRRVAQVTGVDEQWLLTGGGTVSRFRGSPRLEVLAGGRKTPNQRELFPARQTLSRVK
jgi:transcriptional regulator with XRE-family HTH domain